jgi:hypothetical protein
MSTQAHLATNDGHSSISVNTASPINVAHMGAILIQTTRSVTRGNHYNAACWANHKVGKELISYFSFDTRTAYRTKRPAVASRVSLRYAPKLHEQRVPIQKHVMSWKELKCGQWPEGNWLCCLGPVTIYLAYPTDTLQGDLTSRLLYF